MGKKALRVKQNNSKASRNAAKKIAIPASKGQENNKPEFDMPYVDPDNIAQSTGFMPGKRIYSLMQNFSLIRLKKMTAFLETDENLKIGEGVFRQTPLHWSRHIAEIRRLARHPCKENIDIIPPRHVFCKGGWRTFNIPKKRRYHEEVEHETRIEECDVDNEVIGTIPINNSLTDGPYKKSTLINHLRSGKEKYLKQLANGQRLDTVESTLEYTPIVHMGEFATSMPDRFPQPLPPNQLAHDQILDYMKNILAIESERLNRENPNSQLDKDPILEYMKTQTMQFQPMPQAKPIPPQVQQESVDVLVRTTESLALEDRPPLQQKPIPPHRLIDKDPLLPYTKSAPHTMDGRPAYLQKPIPPHRQYTRDPVMQCMTAAASLLDKEDPPTQSLPSHLEYMRNPGPQAVDGQNIAQQDPDPLLNYTTSVPESFPQSAPRPPKRYDPSDFFMPAFLSPTSMILVAMAEQGPGKQGEYAKMAFRDRLPPVQYLEGPVPSIVKCRDLLRGAQIYIYNAFIEAMTYQCAVGQYQGPHALPDCNDFLRNMHKLIMDLLTTFEMGMEMLGEQDKLYRDQAADLIFNPTVSGRPPPFTSPSAKIVYLVRVAQDFILRCLNIYREINNQAKRGEQPEQMPRAEEYLKRLHADITSGIACLGIRRVFSRMASIAAKQNQAPPSKPTPPSKPMPSSKPKCPQTKRQK